jgi:predicted MFS family arabinose efflux permease
VRGHAVDRRGARAALLPCGGVHVLCLVGLPFAGRAGSAPSIVGLAAVAGLSVPPLVPAMRVEWQRLLGRGDPRLSQAYAFEAVAQITLFVIGPLVAGLGVTVIGAGATLAASGILVLVGTGAFAWLARDQRGSRARDGSLLGPIRRAGVRRLVLVCALADSALGVVDVAVPAFAQARGQPGAAGVLLALFSGSSVVGGTLYGARSWSAPPERRLTVLMGIAALALAPLALADSLLVLAAGLVLAGAPAAAQWATSSLAIDRIAPTEGAAEAYTWLSTANAVGVAAGAALAGVVLEAAGTSAAFLAGTAALAGAAALTLALRRPLAAS